MHTITKTKPAKQSKAERKAAAAAILAKREAAKSVQPGTAVAVIPAATTETAKPAIDKLTQKRAERAVAAGTVARFYHGASLPFKSASERFADLRSDKPAKIPTVRQAALLAAMLISDTADNIKADGTFTRGGFRVFVTRNETTQKLSLAAETDNGAFPIFAQPETGCLSDGIGRLYSYVSGPIAGSAQRETVLRVNLAVAATELCLLPPAISGAARERVAALLAAKA